MINELAHSSGVGIEIDESSVPILENVAGACELLGLDPLNIANEGKMIAVVEASSSERILNAMRSHPCGKGAVIIGQVTDGRPGQVSSKTAIGGRRVVDMPAGEQLPRIC